MIRSERIGWVGALAAACFGVVDVAKAAGPTFYPTDLAGGENPGISSAKGINNVGQIVGEIFPSTGVRAMLWSPFSWNGTSGAATEIAYLEAAEDHTYGNGINNFGQIVGRAQPGANRPYLWTPSTANGTIGTALDLGDLQGSTFVSPVAMNSYGQVAGFAVGGGGFKAVLWTPHAANGSTGTMVDLPGLPNLANFKGATDVNDSGQVIGWHEDAQSSRHSFLWTPSAANGTSGSTIDLGDLPGGSFFSSPASINALGWVVGSSDAGTTHGYLWTPQDGLIDLNTLVQFSEEGWIITGASSINDLGQIVASAKFDPDGPGGGAGYFTNVLLTPTSLIPEPATLSLALLPPLLLRRRRAQSSAGGL